MFPCLAATQKKLVLVVLVPTVQPGTLKAISHNVYGSIICLAAIKGALDAERHQVLFVDRSAFTPKAIPAILEAVADAPVSFAPASLHGHLKGQQDLFHSIYRFRAFVHWYCGDGMLEGELSDGREDIDGVFMDEGVWAWTDNYAPTSDAVSSAMAAYTPPTSLPRGSQLPFHIVTCGDGAKALVEGVAESLGDVGLTYDFSTEHVQEISTTKVQVLMVADVSTEVWPCSPCTTAFHPTIPLIL